MTVAYWAVGKDDWRVVLMEVGLVVCWVGQTAEMTVGAKELLMERS